jgi:hypothetical protein
LPIIFKGFPVELCLAGTLLLIPTLQRACLIDVQLLKLLCRKFDPWCVETDKDDAVYCR